MSRRSAEGFRRAPLSRPALTPTWCSPSPARRSAPITARSVGLLILLVMVVRVVWRLGHPPPPLPAGFWRIEALAAHADHALMYLLFLVMPLSGYLNAAAAGHTVSLFGLALIPPLVPENPRLSQAAIAVHLVGQFLVYGLVAVHVAAALTHRIVRRNTILERMLPLRRPG